MSAEKQKAFYRPKKGDIIIVGYSAYIYAIDHPKMGSSDVITGRVISYDKSTGIFDTKNTIYTPEDGMRRTIEISDDICDILMDICSKMRIPATLTIEERCEFAIDALANSYDAAMPVRAEQLKEHTELNMEQAINTALNPNIGMEFTRDPKPMVEVNEDTDPRLFK